MRYPRSLMPIEPGRAPLRVFLTVDTEIWPRAAGWPHTPAATRRDVRARARRLLLGGRGSRPARAAVSAGDPRATWPEGHLLRRPALLALSRGSAPRRGRPRHRRGPAGDRASPAPRLAHRSALPRSPGVRGAPAAPVRCRGAGSAGARGPTHPVRRGRVGDLRIPRRDLGREPRHAARAPGPRHPLRLQPERLHRGVVSGPHGPVRVAPASVSRRRVGVSGHVLRRPAAEGHPATPRHRVHLLAARAGAGACPRAGLVLGRHRVPLLRVRASPRARPARGSRWTPAAPGATVRAPLPLPVPAPGPVPDLELRRARLGAGHPDGPEPGALPSGAHPHPAGEPAPLAGALKSAPQPYALRCASTIPMRSPSGAPRNTLRRPTKPTAR